MATKPAPVSHMFDLKDLIQIVTLVVTITIAWGVFSTRITVLEREVVDLQTSRQARIAQIDKLDQQVSRLNAHQQDDELILDQVFSLLHKPAPVRHALN